MPDHESLTGSAELPADDTAGSGSSEAHASAAEVLQGLASDLALERYKYTSADPRG